jgi:hypothetical protein
MQALPQSDPSEAPYCRGILGMHVAKNENAKPKLIDVKIS